VSAARLLRSSRRRPESLAATYTFGGRSLHSPRDQPSGPLRSTLLRNDGWGALVDARRIMVLTTWPSVEALDAHERTVSWPADAERWHVRLIPVRTTGTLHGRDPLDGISAAGQSGALPGVVFTYAGVPPRNLPAFYRLLLRSAAEQQSAAGALASFATPGLDGLSFSGFTVSAWRTLTDALAYAHRGPHHAAAMRWHARRRASGHASEAWFARCVLERSQGTIAGRDPFADIAAAPDAALTPGTLAAGRRR